MKAILISCLLLAATLARGQEAHIYCGPGLGNCSSDPNQVDWSSRNGWKSQDAGVFLLENTSITITYQAASDNFKIEWTAPGATMPIMKFANDLDTAKKAALRWRDDLVQMGFKP